MSNPGIISQYGFEYQKKVYFYILNKHINLHNVIEYENLDDVSISDSSTSDNISYNINLNTVMIQCKTGNLSKTTITNVILNWLLFQDVSIKYILNVETYDNFENSDIIKNIEKHLNKYLKKIEDGKGNPKAILYKVINKYKLNTIKDFSQIRIDALTILDNMEVEKMNIQNLDDKSYLLFSEKYSSDLELDYSKKERFESFEQKIFSIINSNILKKQSVSLDFQKFNNIALDTVKEIDDENYNIDYTSFKDESLKEANEIFDSKRIEVNLLKKIFNDRNPIVNFIVSELYYKELRNFYTNIEKENKIDEVEMRAKEFYDEEVTYYNDIKEIFRNLTRRDLKGVLINNEFNKGCYLFLSSEEAPEEYFLSWEINDEK